MDAYRGKLLRVDLSSEKISRYHLDKGLLRAFLGGSGLGSRILYEYIDESTNPLGPQNPLLFITGPFCGTRVPAASKATVCAKSPQTGMLGYSTFGGHLGADIRFAGYDGLLIEGIAKSPIYVLVEDSTVEIRDAAHLWEMDTQESWETLKEETGHRRAGMARIGIAGENLVKFATIMIDHYRAAGRTGMGAVMGSKKLKAIVVHGTQRDISVAKSDELSDFVAVLNQESRNDATFNMYSELGTAGFVDMATMMYGSLPVKYYTESDFDAYAISGSTVKETILTGKKACYRCPIGCGRVIEIDEGEYATGEFVGPELEITGTLGTLIMNNDLEALSYANKKLDLLGMDTISAGNIIAFAYYLFDQGIVSQDDLDGIMPKWGNVDAAITFMDKIASRDGIGDIMAEGSREFGRKFGAEHLAAQVNGLELPQHDPRAFSGMTLAYTTSPRGACHMTADMYNVQMGVSYPDFGIESEDRFANEAKIAARLQNLRSLTNSALICNFYPVKGKQLAKLLELVTGWVFSLEDMNRIGERIFTLQRMLNLKLGYEPTGEELPDIVMRPLDGPTEGYVPDVEEHLNLWYEIRDWDRNTGKPSNDKLRRLDLIDLPDTPLS
ncbi:MAG: aldehyde ferredoxin oxidoreductase family protein [Candidatus Thorarchaeota archaeon]|nr:aldehyde ferredoxin oxidoreductase family protein [Candidatus Thorarchaeota archaeon]